jgi:hypothetical protein
MWRFTYILNSVSICKILIITLVCNKNTNFSPEIGENRRKLAEIPENWRKLAKIGETVGHK